jgi:predicted cupin superfamily sugar epimerase
MKSLLALATLALIALVFEEKARQVAGDVHDAVDQAVVQAREAKQSLAQKVEHWPLISLVVAGGLAYALATILPARE